MIHFLLVVFFAWWAFNIFCSIVRWCWRLVFPKPEPTYTRASSAMMEEGSRRQQKMDEFRQHQWEARCASDERRGREYKYECAMKAWHAGYGPRPERKDYDL